MVAFSKIALAFATAGTTFATPLAAANPGPLALFDTLKAIPTSWVSQGAAPKDQLIRAQIGLKQANVQKLQAKLLDISNPDSANYGNWISKSEVDAMVAPSKANVALVKAWLALAGVTEVDQPSPDWIEFTVPVSKMESLLDAKYESFWHAEQGRSVPRTKQYSVPKALHNVIDMVTPTTAFAQRMGPHVTEHDEQAAAAIHERASCDTTKLTPACLKQIYNVDYQATGKSFVGTTEYVNVAASHSDYSMFTNMYAPNTPDFKDISVTGGSNAGQGSDNTLGEGNLDTQWAGALASPNPSQYISVGPENSFSDEISNFASWLTSTANPPPSVSSSYGDFEDNFSSSYLDRVCNEFMKAGSMGISVFWSSGDSGIGGNQASSCRYGFYSVFPGSCPWITSVGGTQFNGTDEVVAEFRFSNGYQGSSGGGFSEHFTIPDYQSKDVATYKSELGSKYNGYYNKNGRGYPDVSLVANNYVIAINGRYAGEGGTSASAPAWAGLVSLLNDYRKSMGKPNLGFLNPLLYGNGRSALRDVTKGDNTGCHQSGFPALSGWDPATGLGSLDFAKLRALI